jgi:hypothetical protein
VQAVILCDYRKNKQGVFMNRVIGIFFAIFILVSGLLLIGAKASGTERYGVFADILGNVDGAIWDDLEEVTGVAWDYSFYDTGAHYDDYDRQHVTGKGERITGKSKNHNLGVVDVSVYGVKNTIRGVEINIGVMEEDVYIYEGDTREKGIEYLFGAGEVERIITSCDSWNALGDSDTQIFRYTKNGKRPLYVAYEESSGSGGTWTTIEIVPVEYNQDSKTILWCDVL